MENTFLHHTRSEEFYTANFVLLDEKNKYNVIFLDDKSSRKNDQTLQQSWLQTGVTNWPKLFIYLK